jgi:hypothetical protein
MSGKETKVADAAHVVGGAWAGDVEWEGRYGACYCGGRGVFFWPEEGGGGESLSFSAGEGGWEVNGLGIDLKYGS